MTGFVRPQSTQEAVLAELRRRIGAGELRPGEQIRAEVVGAELGVSRVPVREALRILEGEGQVVYEPHRGSFVADLSLDDLRELYRMRELLEEEAVRAALPLDAETLERLTDHVADADTASARGDLSAYAESNRRFHLELYAASGRPLLARTIRQLWDASDAYRALYANRGAHRAVASDHHRSILAALTAGDADAVVEAQDRHREHALAALTEILAEAPATTAAD